MRNCIIVGHRGANGLAPENTLLSFRTAIEIGVDMVELDVHQTKDGHLVCIHDYEVDRTTNGTGLVSNLSLEEIQQLDAGKKEHIPLLEEVLDLARGKVSVNIELKVLDVEQEIINLVNKKQMKNDVIVSSFLHGTLQEVHDIDAEVKTAVLVSNLTDGIIEYVQNLHAVALNPLYTLVTPGLVAEAQTHKIRLYPWTVNNPENMVELFRMGVNGIITDYPDVAIETMKQVS